MRYLDATFDTPQENLACDEALLELGESDGREILRLWQPKQPFVVLGVSNHHRTEVNLTACRKLGIAVLRRISGGGAVVQMPGCLNFSLILQIQPGALSTIRGTTCWILQRVRQALQPLSRRPISIRGSSDLAVDGRKFCGNAQRRKKRSVLFHGCLLLDADLRLVTQLLPQPSRQPAWRNRRPHAAFLTNLGLPPDTVRAALRQSWGATLTLGRLPADQITHLARTQYASDAWNYRF